MVMQLDGGGGAIGKVKIMLPPDPSPQTHPWLFVLGATGKPALTWHYSGETATALKRSWDLLMDHLDEKQRRELATTGRITISKAAGRTVTIVADSNHVNVSEVTPFGRRVRFCTYPKVNIPLWDTILTQVLAVKYNWEYFRRMAHRY